MKAPVEGHLNASTLTAEFSTETRSSSSGNDNQLSLHYLPQVFPLFCD